jgi:hypothetical protein
LSITFSTMERAIAWQTRPAAQARREGRGLAERVLHLLRQRLHHRGQEQARRDGVHADAVARQFAGDRQRHADHAGLRGRVGGLADLALEGGDRGGVDDHAALALGVGLALGHRHGGEADHVEGADQVDAD